ncbi:hypothetical protein [Novosphingobium profundi]|uniref:hypothetical protein n=1 Tax=Novosphingobium profundi TaxID=1774954 RepID=UPI001FEA8160|nr:hypothetical protein [Novosphingobium profundi]
MRTTWKLPPRKYLAAGAALAICGTGAAEAASEKLHHMKVHGPDGEVIDVAYAGRDAPRVEIVPTSAAQDDASIPAAVADPFVQMERVSAMMDAQMNAMMQRAALMQRQSAALQARTMQEAKMTTRVNGQPVEPGFAMAGTLPQGVQVSYYSSSTDASGCTRSVSYSSDGSGAAPRMVQAASDSCEAAEAPQRAIPAKVEAPVSPRGPEAGTNANKV